MLRDLRLFLAGLLVCSGSSLRVLADEPRSLDLLDAELTAAELQPGVSPSDLDPKKLQPEPKKDPKGTLPGVEVRPAPNDPAPMPDPFKDDDPPTKPAKPAAPATPQVTPNNAPSNPPPFDDPSANDISDLPSAFPSLSQQTLGGGDGAAFGGLDGLLRGNQSLMNIPSLGSVIDRQQLNERQPVDMFHALQFEVGVLMQQTARGQASPFLRGLTGQQVLILVDGIRMNNSTFRTGPNQYFNLIDPGQVDRIEVIRGAQSTMWGSDAIGGVINVVTRSPSQCRGDYCGGSFVETFGSADSSLYSRGNIEGWVGSSGVFAGGHYLNVRDLDRGGDLGRQPFTNYDQYSGDVKVNTFLAEDLMMTIGLQHFEQNELPRSDRFLPFVLGPPANTPRPTFFDPQQRDLAYVRFQGLSHGNSLFDAASTTLSYQREKEGSLEIRSATDHRRGEFDVDVFGYTLNLAKDLDGVGRLTYGVDYYHDSVDSFRNRINPVANTITRQNPQFPNDATYDRFGAFLNWEVPVTCRLDLITGVRYENINAFGTVDALTNPNTFSRTYQDWIGSLGFVYRVTDCLNLVGGVYEGFRAPNLDDLTADNTLVQQGGADSPSLNVESEHAYNYEIGIKYDTECFRFQVVEFWTDLQDAIQRQRVGNTNNFIRANFDSYINGTEATGEYLFGNGWSTYGNFWYTYGIDRDRRDFYSRIPPTQGVVGLRWRDECQRHYADVFTWLVRRADRYAEQNLTDSRFIAGGTPGYGTLNMRLGTRLGECDNHRLNVTLENITDKKYRVLGSGVDGPGFNAIVGYEYLW